MTALRVPGPDDRAAWGALWQDYLEFCEHALPAAITDLTWRRFHDPAEPVHCLCAFDGNRMTGFVTYVLHRSTWAADHYCYLEDLYVDAAERGKGTARRLIEAVREEARRHGSERLYWNTDRGNATAQRLYDRLAGKTDYIQYRMPL